MKKFVSLAFAAFFPVSALLVASSCTSSAENKKAESQSAAFQPFLKEFLESTFWGKNVDSLLFVQSPELSKYFHPKIIFGRYFNPGAYCYLYQTKGEYGYQTTIAELTYTQPVVKTPKFIADSLPVDGFCEGSQNPDGVYYKTVSEFPEYPDLSSDSLVMKKPALPADLAYKQKIQVQILKDKFIIKTMYFVQVDNRWYLVFFNDCDCSA